jgi:hypothetical protein
MNPPSLKNIVFSENSARILQGIEMAIDFQKALITEGNILRMSFTFVNS